MIGAAAAAAAAAGPPPTAHRRTLRLAGGGEAAGWATSSRPLVSFTFAGAAAGDERRPAAATPGYAPFRREASASGRSRRLLLPSALIK